jgi:hypothetical protein
MPFDERTLIVAIVIVALTLSSWRRSTLRRRSSDALTRMYGVLEDLTKAGLAAAPSLRTNYAAIQFCRDMAGLYHTDGKYTKAITQALAAIAQADALLYRDSGAA